MSEDKSAKESLTAIINGLFQSINAENETKSQSLIEELCKFYEKESDIYYQISMHLEMDRMNEIPAKPFLLKHPEIERWDKFYIESIYNGLFSHWLDRMIRTLDGWWFSGDKERFITRCVIQSIVEQTNISLYRTYADYGDKYDDGKTDLSKQTYWSPSCFKDTNEVKEKFRQWWRVIKED